MNSKGFTLIELLMSIVVLALILAIAIPSVNSISRSVRENQRNNLIKRIEIAAEKYAFDTGKTIIFVDELVTEGYIESDEEDGSIVDPVNNARMNCYIVEMNKNSEYYKAKFNDAKDYDNNGVCDLNKLQQDSTELQIVVSNSNGTINDTSSWIKSDASNPITLKVLSDVIDIDCESNKCVWTSSSGASKIGEDSITLNNISGILNTKYNFQITIYDEDTENIKRYTASIDLKVDNESPVIYDKEIVVTNKFVYTTTKDVQIVASDGKGSGILGYYLNIQNNGSCNNSSITYQKGNKFVINQNGTYLICVKDNSGNISSNTLKISYIK